MLKSMAGCLLGAMLMAQAPAQASCGAAEIEHNRATARKVFEEVLSQGLIDENEALYHPEFVAHGIERDAGRAEDRAASRGWREAVPDLRMEVLRIVADCELVAVHWSGSGTNSGAGNGLPATGKHLEKLWGMTVFGMREGKIHEEWTVFDQYRMLRQLGLLDTTAKP